MNKVLVIVESPAKAKTINRYLGSNYIVKSSIGHVRDLTNSSSIYKNRLNSIFRKGTKKNEHDALADRMGIDPWHDWQAIYEILPNKKKIINELKQIAKKVNHIYLATDRDREGEAIAWHLREIIGGDDQFYSRVIFNEITKKAIQQAFENPGQLNIDRVNAQQARRFMDRIVGYMVSPLLWKKIARGLSAGRVQSVAVKLVVEREREIKAFISEEFWKINACVSTLNDEVLSLLVTHQNNKPFCAKNKAQTVAAQTLLQKASFKILMHENKLIHKKPSAPFITSTLQQAASIQLGFTVKKTMAIAQRLYEAGYITYMRTDSTHLNQDSINTVRDYISKNFGDIYLQKQAIQYSTKKNAQEAHEAIRPSSVFIHSEELEDMKMDEKKLYKLIWCQFVACQMAAAKYDSITLTVSAGNFLLKTHGRTLIFDGWTKVVPVSEKSYKDQAIPIVRKNDELSLTKLVSTQHFTNPPSRFNEASLVKELEKRGIGRPSTYASIISTIQERGYVQIKNHSFYAKKIGEIVTSRLEESFNKLMNYNFTAQMEDNLDAIANHHIEWKKVLDNFFSDFTNQLNKAEKDPEEGGMQPNQIVMTNIDCPTCGRKMGIRTAITGVFLGCSSYFLSLKERCKTTINLLLENEIFDLLEENNTEINTRRIKRRCKKCNNIMDSYLIDLHRKIHICANNPSCDGYENEEGFFRIKAHDNSIMKCDKCNCDMYIKIGRFGKYIACSSSKCNNTRKILYNGQMGPIKDEPIPFPELSCEKSTAYFVLRNGAAGIFLAANTFPKSLETRPALVEELYRFRNRLPDRLRYLADAPQRDVDGNKTMIRFSRKFKQQYVAAEKGGKATGWVAFFIDGKWIESNSKK